MWYNDVIQQRNENVIMIKKILLLNGPNLNMLGKREPQHYGSLTLADIEQQLQQQAAELGLDLDCFQTNSEEKLIDKIHQAFEKVEFILINPA